MFNVMIYPLYFNNQEFLYIVGFISLITVALFIKWLLLYSPSAINHYKDIKHPLITNDLKQNQNSNPNPNGYYYIMKQFPTTKALGSLSIGNHCYVKFNK